MNKMVPVLAIASCETMNLGAGYTCLNVGARGIKRRLYCIVMREGSLVPLNGTRGRDRRDLTYFRLGL